jgi:hypothetical protein
MYLVPASTAEPRFTAVQSLAQYRALDHLDAGVSRHDIERFSELPRKSAIFREDAVL